VVFGVIIGTGCGGGVVVRGQVLAGANAIAGEWGHNPLPWPADHERPGPACYCGQHGCLETWLSGPGLARDFQAAGGGDLSARAIAAGAERGDAACLAALERYEDRLARGLAQVINVLDPDVIVLGGGLSNIARLYDNVPRLWGRHVFSDHVATRLAPPRHGDSRRRARRGLAVERMSVGVAHAPPRYPLPHERGGREGEPPAGESSRREVLHQAHGQTLVVGQDPQQTGRCWDACPD
jgi:predicted NBD/HSP70 family sugar kinase